tara:strand:- start:764 stop:886 length:123 start_codon:yes stop_codon:yes gene_type:complete
MLSSTIRSWFVGSSGFVYGHEKPGLTSSPHPLLEKVYTHE